MREPNLGKSAFNFGILVIFLVFGVVIGTGGTLWLVRRFFTTSSLNVPEEEVEMDHTESPESGKGTNIPGTESKAFGVANQVSSDGQFRFELQGCSRTERSILCNFRITNLTEREILFILDGKGFYGSRTLAYTDNGLELDPNQIFLGSRSGGSEARQTLVAKVPTPASFQFQGMPPLDQLSLLKIGYRYQSLETDKFLDGTIEFRSIPLTD